MRCHDILQQQINQVSQRLDALPADDSGAVDSFKEQLEELQEELEEAEAVITE